MSSCYIFHISAFEKHRRDKKGPGVRRYGEVLVAETTGTLPVCVQTEIHTGNYLLTPHMLDVKLYLIFDNCSTVSKEICFQF